MVAQKAEMAVAAVSAVKNVKEAEKKEAPAITNTHEAETKAEVAALSNKASNNLKLARGLYAEKYGVSSIFRPKYWMMTVSSVIISKPLPIIAVVLIGCIAFSAMFFGMISACYSIYFLKTVVVVIANTFITIANAILFGMWGLSQLMTTAFMTLINSMMYYFIGPVISGINALSSWLGQGEILDFAKIALGPSTIAPQPSHAFSYIVPDPVAWGDWSTVLSTRFVHPGANPYLVGEYMEVLQQNGAALLYPKYDPVGIAEGFWSEVSNASGSFTYSWSTYADHAATFTEFVGKMVGSLTETTKSIMNGMFNWDPLGIGQWWDENIGGRGPILVG